MTPVSDQERYRRVVEEGSNRKRDLAGHRRVCAALEARARKEMAAHAADAEATGAMATLAAEGWPAAIERLQAAVPESTFKLWLEPLRPVAAIEDTLYLHAPEGIRAWAERRYSALIVAALAEVTPYRRVSFAAPWGSA
jgi:hypothetical protein